MFWTSGGGDDYGSSSVTVKNGSNNIFGGWD